jgi:nucleotide-binding universal stress UspA family protein
MSLRSILLLFSGEENEIPALQSAFMLASRYNAHINCLHISIDPKEMIYPYLEIGFPLTIDIREEYQRLNQERFDKSSAIINAQAQHYHFPINPSPIPAHHASFSFHHRTGAIDKITAQEGKFADIIMMGRSIRHVSSDYEAALIAALFDTGRPVLLIPPTTPPAMLDNIITLNWNNSKEAMRAITSALFLLKQSERICILTGKSSKTSHDTRQLHHYLSLHGLEASEFTVSDEQYSTGLALINRAKNLHATLMVMGAFSHTRLQEMVMGGVTRFMMDHAEIPVLMVH